MLANLVRVIGAFVGACLANAGLFKHSPVTFTIPNMGCDNSKLLVEASFVIAVQVFPQSLGNAHARTVAPSLCMRWTHRCSNRNGICLRCHSNQSNALREMENS